MSEQKMFSAREESIHQIFKEKRYSIPYYQRPYSWLKDNAESLWDDLFSTWQEGGMDGSGYFLGSVVLVNNPNSGRDEVVDGQQRFITLQLLLCALSHSLNSADKRRKLTGYFISEEDEFAGTKAELVLQPGTRYQSAYERILNNQSPEEHDTIVGKRFLENYKIFRNHCEDLNQDEIADFSKFILQKSFIAVLRAEDQLRALRIFAILNDRGIDLHPVDILKANILEKTNLSEGQKSKYAERWEEYEEDFERKRFQDLIGHIRMTYIRARTQNPLHDDILDRLKTAKQSEEFLKTELPSFAKAFEALHNSEDIDVRNLVEIGRRAGFKDWEAPALFLTRKKSEVSNYKQIIKEITGIVVFLAITKAPDGQRAGRFGKMIGDLELILDKKKKLQEVDSLKISKAEWAAFETALKGNAYGIRGLRAGLLWLECISGDDDRSVESSEITIEHVLPRAVGTEDFWLDRFSEQVWKEHSNRLGNLLLVSGRSNTKMARKPFKEKMKYVEQKGGSSWIWTQDALQRNDWTMEEIEEREKAMLARFKKRFNITAE